MDGRTLAARLKAEKEYAIQHFNALPDNVFFSRPQPEKWSPAEVLQHLVLSVRPLNLAYSLPRFSLRLLFGTPNRPERTYEQLVEKYKQKLALGGKASAPFIPKPIRHGRGKLEVINSFANEYSTFERKVASTNEADFNRHLLPHPLLGKLTLREMTYFTIHHLEHHRVATRG